MLKKCWLSLLLTVSHTARNGAVDLEQIARQKCHRELRKTPKKNAPRVCGFLLFFFFFFLLFSATPRAYGSSQARGWITAAAAATATQNLSHVCNLHHSSQQRQGSNPHPQGFTSQVLNSLSHSGNSSFVFLMQIFIFMTLASPTP